MTYDEDEGESMPMINKPVDIIIHADMPEQITIRFATTGACGGDAGHGGNTTLEIVSGGGTYQLGDEQLEEGTRVTFTGWGDWEMSGMISAIIALGKALESEVS